MVMGGWVLFLVTLLPQNFCTLCFAPVLRDERGRKESNFEQNKAVEARRVWSPPAAAPPRSVPANKELPDGPTFLAPKLGKEPAPWSPLAGTVGLGTEKRRKVFYGRAGRRSSAEGARTKVGGGHEAKG